MRRFLTISLFFCCDWAPELYIEIEINDILEEERRKERKESERTDRDREIDILTTSQFLSIVERHNEQ